MSTRVIASIGVMLCLAMTSFSIYLGVAEHIYAPHKVHVVSLSKPTGRDVVCLSSPRLHNISTTGVVMGARSPQCHDPSRISR